MTHNELDQLMKSELTNEEVASKIFLSDVTFTMGMAKEVVDAERPKVRHLLGYKANWSKYYL